MRFFHNSALSPLGRIRRLLRRALDDRGHCGERRHRWTGV